MVGNWLSLGGALSAGDVRWRLVIACALAQAVYPFLYTTIIAGRLIPIDGIIILARDFSLWRWLFKFKPSLANWLIA